ncbi:UNVERIFIED_CONTAM: hypothetical protein HHA_289360 [Hammondia hammondi]|eukprot:XP_008889116.1 hypothetical protein HHA_289360 [Hammondia hammondi]
MKSPFRWTRSFLFFLVFVALIAATERRVTNPFFSCVVLSLAVTPPGVSPQTSLWISSGLIGGSDKAVRGTTGLEGIRIGANIHHKWAKGFDTRLHLSADAGATLGGTDLLRSSLPSVEKSLEFCTGKNGSLSLLSRLCEAVEVSGEAVGSGGNQRLRTVMRYDLPSGRSQVLCTAAHGNHELHGHFCPPSENAPAGAFVSSSHLFQRGEKFVKIQPSHDFQTQTSELRVQGGKIPQEKDEQWTEVNVQVAREHPTNSWDTVVGVKQHFGGGRVSFAPFLRLRDRSLRYEYTQNLSNGGVVKVHMQPAHVLRLQWRDPSASGGSWVAQAELPLQKGKGLREGTVAFRREWTF